MPVYYLDSYHSQGQCSLGLHERDLHSTGHYQTATFGDISNLLAFESSIQYILDLNLQKVER